MWQTLVRKANRLLVNLQRSRPRSRPRTAEPRAFAPASPPNYEPLSRVVLTDGVARTLFDEYADHRTSERGEEETGWVLLGLRESREAVVLATLPAGARADAGVAHVSFDSSSQALASRIVRQNDRRITIVGVVHTHPGSLRHPSDGDLEGDSDWVRNLRGQEGVFGIGTADCAADGGPLFAWQPKPHVQCLGELRFSWYALGEDESAYRPLPVELTIGPDLARPLHSLWLTLEAHAERLDRLCRQQAGVRFDVLGEKHPGLVLTLPLAANGEAVRVVIRHKEVRYYVLRGADILEVQIDDDYVDRGVYVLLAELAGKA